MIKGLLISFERKEPVPNHETGSFLLLFTYGDSRKFAVFLYLFQF